MAVASSASAAAGAAASGSVSLATVGLVVGAAFVLGVGGYWVVSSYRRRQQQRAVYNIYNS